MSGERLLVLALETSTRIGSVAVVSFAAPGRGEDGARAPEVLAEVMRDERLQHGEALLSLVDDCLARAGVDLDGVGVVAVAAGPGSFTGLRVGLATAKGLVLGTRTALIGVPTLEALAATLVGGAEAAGALPTGARLRVCPCLDARRNEVYAALFSIDPRAASAAAPSAVARVDDDVAIDAGALADRLAGIAAYGEGLVLVGDGAERYRAIFAERLGGGARLALGDRSRPRAAAVAAIAFRDLAARGADDPATLVPRYARASEAERVRDAREAAAAAAAGTSDARR